MHIAIIGAAGMVGRKLTARLVAEGTLGGEPIERPQQGRGILLAGVPGVAPAHITILGGGVVGDGRAEGEDADHLWHVAEGTKPTPGT